MTPTAIWPLFDVVVRTPRLAIQYADDHLLTEMSTLAALGIHQPDERPFRHPWTRLPPTLLRRNAMQHWWGLRSSWSTDRWTFIGAVQFGGATVGLQALEAEQFARTRSVTTWSWLGQAHQSRGIGTEMRSAVLNLAFAGLGAETARSSAFADSYASNKISRKLGYTLAREEIVNRSGEEVVEKHWVMTRTAWQAGASTDVEITGLEDAVGFFR